ncbi:MAG: efflux RND transporter periplasmic adaptor subunit, partial [Muribaculaceae bacterium]|nr:efflux RND transporter periplasmic adaptor subunit [Muribaculaceae bacterium]
RDNKLVQTSVTLGVDNSINQEITSGLKRGDKVALQYHQPTVAEKEGKTEENPFMPKRPGANKKGTNK